MSSTSRPIAIHTTRLTRTDQPTGFEKFAQDQWDEIRDKQVRGYEDRTGASAFRSFLAAVQHGAEVLLTKPTTEKTMVCALGSYRILDDKPAVIRKLEDNVVNLQHRKFPCAVNDFLVKHNIFIAQGGIRTTGTVHFTDGSFEVVDPTKGIALDGDTRKFSSIKPIRTCYYYLTRVSPEIAAEVEKIKATKK